MPNGDLLEGEQRASSGNIIALACGPLKKGKRYINPKIELELVDFKKEIEEKFEKSLLKRFVMPKIDEHDSRVFGKSRVHKGRALAQSTDVSTMQTYVHQ